MPYSICLISGEYPPSVGGVADYTALLARQLKDRGHAVVVVTTRPRLDGQESTVDAEVAIRHVDNWGPLAILRVARFLRAGQVEIVHLQYQAAAFTHSRLIHLLPAWLRSMQVAARSVVTFHDLRRPYLFPKAGGLRQRSIQFLVEASDGVVFTDPGDLAEAGRMQGAAWIPIGSNIEPTAPVVRAAARARWSFAEHEHVLAYFGFLNASKGADNLVAATSLLSKQGLPVRLLFVGDERGASDPTNRETAAQARHEAARLGIDDRLTWTGWLPPEEVSSALGAADLAVLPYEDGASLRRGSLLACFAHGLPVVTTRPMSRPVPPSGALVAPFDHPVDFQLDDELAELVDVRADSAALAGAIANVLADEERRDQLSSAGRALVERLSWKAIGEATERFYDRLLSVPPRAARR